MADSQVFMGTKIREILIREASPILTPNRSTVETSQRVGLETTKDRGIEEATENLTAGKRITVTDSS